MDQPQSQEYSDQQRDQEYGLNRCSAHPEVETGLACGRCGRYICPRCMIQTPVGARCRECARVTPHPTFDVRPSYYLRAALAGGVVAIVAGIVWGYLLNTPLTIFNWILALGVGYAVGEAVSLASNRKRGQGLVIIAGISMVLAISVSSSWPSLSAPIGLIFWLVMVGVACYVAVSRVR